MPGGRATVRPMSPPDPDPETVEAFWARYLAASDEPGEVRWSVVERFGDTPAMADQLLALVVDGPKRATAGALADYESDDEPLPAVGDRWIVLDGRGTPRAVLETTEVRVGPLSSVDEAFAWDEGEGDRTRADWLRGHTAYFERRYRELGLRFDDDIAVVFERFDLRYAER